MDTAVITAYLNEINERTDAVQLLNRLGYAADKLQIVGDSIKAFCPIHKDTRFRSLLIDAPKHTYKCTLKTCAGFAGGTLVDLFAKVRKLDVVPAAVEMVGALDLAVDAEWSEKLAASFLDEAERAFVSHDQNTAEQAATTALQFKSDLSEARLLLANIYADRGERSRACDEFLAVAEGYLMNSQFEEADRVLEHAAAAFPDNDDLFFMKIRSAELQGREDLVVSQLLEITARREATGQILDNIGAYEQLVQLRPDDPELRLKLGNAHELRRDIKRACREWEKAGHLLIAAGAGDQATSIIERVLHFEPHLNKLRLALAEELIREGEHARAKQEIFTVINAQIEDANFVAAAEAARKWLDVEPQSIETHESLARIYQEQGLHAEAATELKQAAACAADDPDEGPARALEFLFRSKFLAPEDVEIRREIVRRLTDAGETQRAGFELMDMAESLFNDDKPEDAEAALREAGALLATPEHKLQLASILQSHGRAAAALALHEEIAIAAERDGNSEAALEAYIEILKCDPENSNALLRRCLLAWDLAQPEAAAASMELAWRLAASGATEDLELLLHAAAAHRNDGVGWQNQAFDVSLQSGLIEITKTFYPVAFAQLHAADPQGALTLAQKMLSVNASDERALLDSAELMRNLGDSKTAAETFETLAELNSGRRDWSAALQFVEAAISAAPERLDLLKQKADLLANMDPEQARVAHREYLLSLGTKLPAAQLIREYESYLESWPDDPPVRRRLADALSGTERAPEAERHYCKLLEEAEQRGDHAEILDIRLALVRIVPDDLGKLGELARAYVRAGKEDESEPLWQELLKRGRDAGDFTLAADAARALLALTPDSVELLEQLAECEQARGDLTAFQNCLDGLVARGHLNMAIKHYSELCVLALREKRFSEAEEASRRWLELAPEDCAAIEHAAILYTQQQRTQRAVEMYEQLARIYKAREDADHAVNALRHAISIDAEAIQARQTLWQILLDSGHEQEALSEMRQLADLFIERRSYKEGAGLLSRILEYDTDSASVLERLASLVYEHEGYDKALPYFRKLINLRKEHGTANEITAEYEKLLRLEGAGVDLRIEYAEFLESRDLKESAKQQFLQIAQSFRDELNEPLRAIQFFGRATALLPLPDDSRIFEELASLHMQVNVPEFAGEALREAIRLYEAQEKKDKVLDALKRLVQIPGARVADFSKLGDAYVAANNTQEALQAYQRALSVSSASSVSRVRDNRALCERILQLDPLNFECAMLVLDWLPVEAVVARAIEYSRRFAEAGRRDQQLALLDNARGAGVRSITLHLELAKAARDRKDTERLKGELLELANLAVEEDDLPIARTTLSELSSLSTDPSQALILAPLYEKCGDQQTAATLYCTAAEHATADEDYEAAAKSLRAALTANPAAVSASQVASLCRKSKGSESIREVAVLALDAALTARSRTRALVLGSALLEFSTPDQTAELLERVGQRAGAAFVVALGGVHADWLLDAKRLEDASAVAELVVQQTPGSPDAWWMLGQLYKRVGNKDRSAEASLKAARLFSEVGAVTEEELCYRETLEEFPNDAGVLQSLAYFYERERRTPDALSVMLRLATLSEGESNAEAAAQWLMRAVSLQPTDIDLRERLAELLVQTGRDDGAVEQLLEIARLHMEQSSDDKAVAVYERILALQNASESAISSLLVLADRSGDSERFAHYSLLLADAKAQSHNLKEAGKVLRDLLARDPDNIQALEKLAQLSKQAGDDRAYCSALDDLGHRFAKTGQYERAVEAFEQLHELKPNDVDTLQILLDCCVAQDLPEKAAAYGEDLLARCSPRKDARRVRQAALTVLQFDESRPTARRHLAAALLELKETDQAIVEWTRAAQDFASQKEYAEAVDCLRSVTKQAPNDSAALQRLADALILNGDTDAARDAFLRLADMHIVAADFAAAESATAHLLQVNPSDAVAHEKLLAIHRLTGNKSALLDEVKWLTDERLERRDYAGAEAILQEGIEADPSNSILLQRHIFVLKKLGRVDEIQYRLRELAGRMLQEEKLEEAVRALEQLRELDPEVVNVRIQLASLYARLGQDDTASEEYAHIVSSQLQKGEAEEARETAQSATRALPGNLPLAARLAEAFAANGIPEAAARYYASCAAMAATAGDVDDQIRYLKLVVHTRPRWAEGLSQLAEAALSSSSHKEDGREALVRLEQLFIEQKQFPEAIAVLKRHLQISSDEIAPRRRLIEVYERTGDRDNRAAQLKELAEVHFTLGQTEDAIKAYGELSTLRPDDVSVLQRYIEILSTVRQDKDLVGEHRKLAAAYAARGMLLEATRTFEKAISQDRRNVTSHEQFIEFLLRHGQRSRAVAEILDLAGLYAETDQYEFALPILEKALSMDPRNADVCTALGEAKAALGNAAGAAASLLTSVDLQADLSLRRRLEIIRRAVALAPESLAARERLRDLLASTDERAEAAANFMAIAELHSSAGNASAARDAFTEALRLNSPSVDAMRSALNRGGNKSVLRYLECSCYGDAFMERGDVDDALEAYKQARDINDEDPALLQKYIDALIQVAPEQEAIPDMLRLASLYVSNSDTPNASELYRHVLLLDPECSEAKTGLQRLNQ